MATRKKTTKRAKTTLGSTRRGKAPKKRTTKKRSKRATKKRATKKASRKRRTPAQIRATKRLVAMNRARAKGEHPRRKKTAKKTSHRRHTKAYWTKWAAAQPEKRDVEGRLMFQGPMTPASDAAMRRAMKAMGLKSAEMYRGSKGELVVQAPMTARQARIARPKRIPHGSPTGFVGPLPPRAHKAAVKHKARFGVKYETLRQQYFKAKAKPATTAAGILKKAQKEAKYSRLSPILKSKRAAVWVCGNPLGKRTGCGGGKKHHAGSRVVGILA